MHVQQLPGASTSTSTSRRNSGNTTTMGGTREDEEEAFIGNQGGGDDYFSACSYQLIPGDSCFLCVFCVFVELTASLYIRWCFYLLCL